MKRKSILTIIAIMAISLLLCSCDPESKKSGIYNPGITSIKDFARYSQIGMRAVSAKSGSRAVQSVEDMRYQLVAMDRETGTIDSFYMGTEAGSFVDSGKLNVFCYMDTEPFLIVQFGYSYYGNKKEPIYCGVFEFPNADLSPIYFISKETGNIYSFGDGKMFFNTEYDTYGWTSDTFYCIPEITYMQMNFYNGSDEPIICKVYEEQGKLKLEPWIRGYKEFFADKYGNLLLQYGNPTLRGHKVFTADRELKPSTLVFENAFVGYDGLIHEGTSAISQEGESFSFGTSVDKSHVFYPSHMLEQEGLTRWYYCADNNLLNRSKRDRGDGIYKIVFDDDTYGTFTVEDEFLFNTNTCKIGWKFFKREGNTIYTYEYPSGARDSRTITDCTVRSIKAEKGKIRYDGLSNDMLNTVTGWLDPETLADTSAPTINYSETLPVYMTAL